MATQQTWILPVTHRDLRGTTTMIQETLNEQTRGIGYIAYIQTSPISPGGKDFLVLGSIIRISATKVGYPLTKRPSNFRVNKVRVRRATYAESGRAVESSPITNATVAAVSVKPYPCIPSRDNQTPYAREWKTKGLRIP